MPAAVHEAYQLLSDGFWNTVTEVHLRPNSRDLNAEPPVPVEEREDPDEHRRRSGQARRH
ncbi:hypothetical protein [Humibacter albus]|uniref:hypothetical protein n=1 Tax=Humibacter albus TaxID=427754 RepID=UPI0012F8AD12|nr:hypothetical protein [Humibacter albus]